MEGLPAETQPEDEAALFAWVEATCGGPITRATQTSGGNRCRSWAIDAAGQAVFLRYNPPRPPGVEPYTLRREADVYRAIADAGLLAPRLLGEHPDLPAILTERAPGIAEYRRLRDPATRQAIAEQFMAQLARLHRMDVSGLRLAGGGQGARIIDHTRAELAIWHAMYNESIRTDSLIELALQWLVDNMPDPSGPVVLAHGDAGPGNFLFEDGRLTAVIDWELAHLGDPMEDIAWLSMRCVMEPVPDFPAALRAYVGAGGFPIDRQRVLYHRVLVSTRVVIIRHRNVTGEPAHAIVSEALNRRLLVEALSEASGVAIDIPPPVDSPPTPRDALFERVLGDLRDVVVARSTDPRVVAAAKNAAKVVKYLQAHDRYGAAIADADRAHGVGETFADTLRFYARQTARQAQLASGASGGIAGRHYPPLGTPL
jgi:aminoglycoside phosphotransferase (APT) family kinase protein